MSEKILRPDNLADHPKNILLKNIQNRLLLGVVTLSACLSASYPTNAFAARPDGTKCTTTKTVESSPTGTTITSVTKCEPSTSSQGSHPTDNRQKSSNSEQFMNPLRYVRELDPWRIDEGVDYHGYGKVMAVGPGVVTDATTHSRFFADDGGNNVIYRLTAGNAKGEYIYVAEACKPSVHIGERVTDKTAICTMFGGESFPGIETGEYSGPKDQDEPMADTHGQYTQSGLPDGVRTSFGNNMNQRLMALGVPSGNTTHKHPHRPPYTSTNQNEVVGKLPPNWPTKF
jgi:hypothetical protein